MILADQIVVRSELARSWSLDPVLALGLIAAAVAYGRGLARLSRRAPRPHRGRRTAAFYGGLGVAAAALMSPLDPLASTLFSAHMVQHLLLMLVAAPLLVAAHPAAALVAGLPAAGRDVVRGDARRGLRAAARLVANPLVVWIIGAVALWSWHMPALYEAALAHDALHALEHLSFLATALLFWHVVLTSGVRRGTARPIATLLVVGTSVQSSALGAVLLFAGSPLYPGHEAGAVAWDMSPLEDQQLAGGLMWGPPALLYVLTMGWLVVRWFAEMDEASSSSPPPEPRLVAAGEPA